MNQSAARAAFPTTLARASRPYRASSSYRLARHLGEQGLREVNHQLNDTLTETEGQARNTNEADAYAGSF